MSQEAPVQNGPRLSYNPYAYRRRRTRVVPVGHVMVGGSNPIRVQSMTTTDTMNTEATVAQTLRLADVGCEIVRITAPNEVDARNLENIKSALVKKGCLVPLVADIHFRPEAAMIAADFVEKVRINPGNYVDSKLFRVREYTDEQYESELHRIEDRFTPLVEKMKRLKRAMRIGTNHGSLSDRIMNRYGDSPEGMVESALEYVRICRKNDYHDIILSMKASNPRVMIEAYRLLAARMADEDMDYPFHLGVTEAGDGPDGRIKSAAGIGSLLEDGIGDTIRVSLTEDPEFEVPVAREIAARGVRTSVVSLSQNGKDWQYDDNGVRAFVRSWPNGASDLEYEVSGETGRFRSFAGAREIEWTQVDMTGPRSVTIRRPFPYPQRIQSPGVRVVLDLVQCLETGKEPNCTGEDARAALEIAIALRESHRQGGRRIDLPLADRSLLMHSAETLAGDLPVALRRARS